jgi:hypothetical protein
MSKVFRRPMFRKGGSTNGMTGIMSGIQDRNNYQDAGRVSELTKENLDLLMQNAPQDTGFDPLTTFLLQFGPSLATAKPTGNIVSTALSAAQKPVESLLASQAERRKYLRDLKSGAAQLAIEQAGREKLLEKEIAGRKEIEGMKTKISPEKTVLLEQNIEAFGPNNIAVAKRATDFQTEKSGELYRKVGPKAQGVITFDINDPAQVKQQIKEIKRLDGKIVYDPYQDNYKLIKFDKKTKKPLVKTYNSIEEIPSGEEEIIETIDKDKKDTIKTTEKTETPFKNMGEYQQYLKEQQKELFKPVPIEQLGQPKLRTGRG